MSLVKVIAQAPAPPRDQTAAASGGSGRIVGVSKMDYRTIRRYSNSFAPRARSFSLAEGQMLTLNLEMPAQ